MFTNEEFFFIRFCMYFTNNHEPFDEFDRLLKNITNVEVLNHVMIMSVSSYVGEAIVRALLSRGTTNNDTILLLSCYNNDDYRLFNVLISCVLYDVEVLNRALTMLGEEYMDWRATKAIDRGATNLADVLKKCDLNCTCYNVMYLKNKQRAGSLMATHPFYKVLLKVLLIVYTYDDIHDFENEQPDFLPFYNVAMLFVKKNVLSDRIPDDVLFIKLCEMLF